MFSENLKALRKQKGMTQEELASRLHVVRQTVSKWEQGRSVPDADLLVRLAEVLETTVAVLLGSPVEEPEQRCAGPGPGTAQRNHGGEKQEKPQNLEGGCHCFGNHGPAYFIPICLGDGFLPKLFHQPGCNGGKPTCAIVKAAPGDTRRRFVFIKES